MYMYCCICNLNFRQKHCGGFSHRFCCCVLKPRAEVFALLVPWSFSSGKELYTGRRPKPIGCAAKQRSQKQPTRRIYRNRQTNPHRRLFVSFRYRSLHPTSSLPHTAVVTGPVPQGLVSSFGGSEPDALFFSVFQQEHLRRQKVENSLVQQYQV